MMLRFIAFGLAAGAGIQAWRQWPADGPTTGKSLAVVFIVGVLLAYVGGRWQGRGRASAATATATAVASSTSTSAATNSVNLAVVVPGHGAAPQRMTVPSEQLPWMGQPRPEISAEDLDGLDLAELVDHDETEATR